MIALFVFNDGKTRVLDIPHANPYYYFPVYRALECNFKSKTLDEEVRRPTVDKAVMKRVGADQDFVFYEEQ